MRAVEGACEFREDRAFSSVDLVGQCLMDPEKAALFKRAIEATVKPEHTVIDIGTGSGILALLMAKAGAKKVYALEFDPFIAEIAQTNFDANERGRCIELLEGDARTFRYPEGVAFDVVTMEMLSTGLVDEMQVQAINNLHACGAVHRGTVFLPARQDSCISLAETDFGIFGFTMKMPIHEWRTFPKIGKRELSNPVSLNSVRFSSPIPELYEDTYQLVATDDGVVNSVRLTSRAYLHDEKTYLESTISVNSPVIFPVGNLRVKKGDRVRVAVRYKFGHGYPNFRVRVSPVG